MTTPTDNRLIDQHAQQQPAEDTQQPKVIITGGDGKAAAVAHAIWGATIGEQHGIRDTPPQQPAEGVTREGMTDAELVAVSDLRDFIERATHQDRIGIPRSLVCSVLAVIDRLTAQVQRAEADNAAKDKSARERELYVSREVAKLADRADSAEHQLQQARQAIQAKDALLAKVREGLDEPRYPTPGTNSREWQSDMGVYLRGQAAAMLMLDPEDMRQLADAALAPDPQPSPASEGVERHPLDTCPTCGGETDNGFDREDPPNPYQCSKCDGLDHAAIADALGSSPVAPEDMTNRQRMMAAMACQPHHPSPDKPIAEKAEEAIADLREQRRVDPIDAMRVVGEKQFGAESPTVRILREAMADPAKVAEASEQARELTEYARHASAEMIDRLNSQPQRPAHPSPDPTRDSLDQRPALVKGNDGTLTSDTTRERMERLRTTSDEARLQWLYGASGYTLDRLIADIGRERDALREALNEKPGQVNKGLHANWMAEIDRRCAAEQKLAVAVEQCSHRLFGIMEADDLDTAHALASALVSELHTASTADFTCPDCGGHFFGRRMTTDADGHAAATDIVDCHDQHRRGCKWRGPFTG